MMDELARLPLWMLLARAEAQVDRAWVGPEQARAAALEVRRITGVIRARRDLARVPIGVDD